MIQRKAQSQSSQNNSVRGGFVLLMVLMAILIAGLFLSGAARQSFQVAMEMSQAQDELQRRWGAVSCQKALLGKAKELLNAQALASNNIDQNASLATSVILGGVEYELLLADEDAKVNLNTVYSLAGRVDVTRLAKEFVGSPLRIRLRPGTTNPEQAATSSFSSWGQIFALEQTQDEFDVPRSLLRNSSVLTCWSNGKLNVHRATDDAIEQLALLVVDKDAVDRLIDVRRDSQNRKLDDILDQLQLEPADRTALAGILSEDSDFYSVWIKMKSSKREWYQFHVVNNQSDGEQSGQTVSFTW